ncbi:hypothetical protein [Deinococcus koreensis]|uniref:CHRD domain-containing protein n=1 Tax=Deinococcus koreensis TaxID=2054903 RepID=A0A2K3V2B9_9DEIO|nr:hypothetical protein [Deinococcus koreensis]PNY82933.1 hypothetical protein CVO96_08110 [Deinococcus koreensis]
MIRRALFTLTVLALAAPAQALEMIVWDRELQTKLGDGKSVGGKFNVRMVDNYEGPVVILFALTDDEKARGSFPNLKSRYNGLLSGGELSLQAPAQGGERALNTTLSLSKFLTPYKLTLNIQPAGQSLSLPGLKAPSGQSR